MIYNYNGIDVGIIGKLCSIMTITHVIHHIDELDLIALIKSMHANLLPGGHVVVKDHDIVESSVDFIYVLHLMFGGGLSPGDFSGNIRRYSMDKIRDMFESCGFKLTKNIVNDDVGSTFISVFTK